MVQPEEDQGAEEVRTPEEGAVDGFGCAHDDVVAATGAGVAAVEHEFFGAEAAESGRLVEAGGVLNECAPVGGGVGVDFDDAGVWGDLYAAEPMVEGGCVAFDQDWQLELGGCIFYGHYELHVFFSAFGWRHEDVEAAAAWFDREGGADGFVGAGGESLFADLLAGFAVGGFCGDGALRALGGFAPEAYRGSGGFVGKGAAWGHGVDFEDLAFFVVWNVWEALDGEAEAYGGIAWNEE